MRGKIVKGIAGFYYVHTEEAGIFECKAKGSFRNQKIKPLVGDDVELDGMDSEKKLATISEVLPRKNELIRPAVANVDQAVLLFAAAAPAPNYQLLDRFLILMQQQGVPVILCFNKKDLISKEEQDRIEDGYRGSGYEIRFLSAMEQDGTEELSEILRGKTTVLAGPSGVGKSTLTNSLQNNVRMETGAISEKIQRGKHTTRHSEFIWVGEETYLLDTPGFSSLSLEQIDADSLKFYFPEFAPYEDGCRYRGCVHEKEPGCLVKQALAEGRISRRRYESYLFLYHELKNVKKYK